MEFRVLPARLEMEALEEIRLPEGTETNIFRGAFGMALRKVSCGAECPGVRGCPSGGRCAYARVFEPAWEGGPSGYQDPPRPFVLRVGQYGGRVRAGERFRAEIFLFDSSLEGASDRRAELERAFEAMGAAGLGPTRGRARLRAFEQGEKCLALPVRSDGGAGQIRLEFATPTELKHRGEVLKVPEFAAVANRLAERVWTLGRLYQGWPETWDYRDLLDLSPLVGLKAWKWEHRGAMRRSSRTGQEHGIGGFSGWAEYEGPVGAFRALLEIGRWTGVGRQTVWGKGKIVVASGEKGEMVDSADSDGRRS